MNNVKVVHKNYISKHSNIISSHKIYKIKPIDDKTLKLKPRIAPQGNEDSIKMDMRSDCNMCSPCSVRIVLSPASVKCWRVSNADVKAAFIETGQAQRDVYVIPLVNSRTKDTTGYYSQPRMALSIQMINGNRSLTICSRTLVLLNVA